MSDAISVVIERCKGQMPDVLLGEHYGYYRHDDVAQLANEVENLHLILDQIRKLSRDPTIADEDACILIADLAVSR